MERGLLLIDIQNDYFPGGKMELVGMEEASERARRLLELFRKRQAPIFHIKHISKRPGATFFLPDTSGVNIHEVVAPQSGEAVIEKSFPNAFRDTTLFDRLNDGAVEEVIICGAMSHMCIDATTRAAFDLGLSCIVVEDACATRDLEHNGRSVAATDVHAAFMAALSAVYARVISADAVK